MPASISGDSPPGLRQVIAKTDRKNSGERSYHFTSPAKVERSTENFARACHYDPKPPRRPYLRDTPFEMAAPGVRMRLTVDVLPLAEENSHGPYRDVALEAFKGRKFALPVQLEDTFEQVWSQIEERYKRNYLTPAQAASFTIKVLKDAYDCDLDLSDTVSEIFEGETDPAKRMIKVVPSFIYRDFSVPLTSNLRPASAQKRQREANEDDSNKRRRLHESRHGRGEVDGAQDLPLPSTESEQSAGNSANHSTDVAHNDSHTGRSKSSSIVQFRHAQTGQEEFGPVVKEESPELGHTVDRTIPESDPASPQSPANPFKVPKQPASRMLRPVSHSNKSVSPLPPKSSQKPHDRDSSSISYEQDRQSVEDTTMNEDQDHGSLGPVQTPEVEAQQPNIQASPESSTPESLRPIVKHRSVKRKDIYEPSSSPESLRPPPQNLKTYGRFPRTPRQVAEFVKNRNAAQSSNKISPSVGNGESIPTSTGGRARAFKRPERDDIVSSPEHDAPLDDVVTPNATKSPENTVHTPQSNGVPQSVKSSSLKKPSKTSYKMPTTDTGRNKAKDFRHTSTASPVNVASNGDQHSASKTSANKPGSTIPTQKPSTLEPSPVSSGIPSQVPRGRSISDAKSYVSAESASAPISGTPRSSGLAKLQRIRENAAAMRGLSKASPQTDQSREQSRISSFSPNATRSNNSRPVSSNQQAQLEPSLESTSTGRGARADTLPDASQKQTSAVETAVSTTEPSSVNLSKGTPDASVSRSTPRRSEVPLPDNVKHLAGANSAIPNGTRTVTEKSDDFKPPAPKTKVSTVVAKSTPNDKLRRSSVTLDPSPLSQGGMPPRDKSRRFLYSGLAIAAAEKEAAIAAAQKTEVPLPENVRHLNGSGTPSIQDHAPGSNAGVTAPSPKQVFKNDSSTPSKHISSAKPGPGKEEIVDEPRSTANTLNKVLVELSSDSSSSEYESDEQDEGEQESGEDQLPNISVQKNVKDVTLAVHGESLPEGNANGTMLTLSDEKETPVRAVETQEHLGSTTKTAQQTPWNSTSWGFSGLGEQQGASDERESEEKDQSESAAASPSAATSARSSPDTARRPARFLSHSPTPQKSSSDEEDGDDDNESQVSAASVPSLKATGANDAETESESSQSDSDSSENDEEEGGDVEMEDADAPPEPTVVSSSIPLPSSVHSIPTPVTSTQTPTPRLPRKTEVPLPGAKPNNVLSSQPRAVSRPSRPMSQVPQSQPSRRTPYNAFPSIRDQLSAVRSQSATAQRRKTFDPASQSLGMLTKAKQKGKKGAAMIADDSSSDDSSSSSSDDDDEPRKNAGCSVA